MFHSYFSNGGEQPEQRILAYKSEQLTAGCIATFDEYCCYIKHGGITNLTLWNPWGMLLMCQNATIRIRGAFIRIYYVSRLKHMTPLAVCSSLPLVRGGPLGVPAFVKLLYCNITHQMSIPYPGLEFVHFVLIDVPVPTLSHQLRP